MMNEKYGYFLVMLSHRELKREDCSIFRSRKAFYTMTGFLIRNHLIGSYHNNGSKAYYLTMRGDMLSMLFSSMDTFSWDKFNGYMKKAAEAKQ